MNSAETWTGGVGSRSSITSVICIGLTSTSATFRRFRTRARPLTTTIWVSRGLRMLTITSVPLTAATAFGVRISKTPSGPKAPFWIRARTFPVAISRTDRPRAGSRKSASLNTTRDSSRRVRRLLRRIRSLAPDCLAVLISSFQKTSSLNRRASRAPTPSWRTVTCPRRATTPPAFSAL